MSGLLAKTWTDDLSGSDLAGKISGHWQAESWDMGASYRDIHKDFNAEMGFINRTDIRGADLWGGKSFEIRRGIFRSAGGGGHYGIITDHDGRLESRDFGFEYGLELDTGDSGGVGATRRWECLEGDWEIREGIVIPRGLYTWYRYGIGGGTDDSRWLKIGGSHGRGGFYTGDRQSASLNGHIRPVPKLLITGSYSWNSIELPGGSFSTNTINSRSIYTFSPDFFIKLLLQWNDDSEVVRGNFLLRYTYRPGSDLYIVYNERWQGGEVEQRSIVAKLTYFFNL